MGKLKKFKRWLKERDKVLYESFKWLAEANGLELIKNNGDWDTWYQMDLSQDEFVHFTTLSRAKEIVESGRLMMNPPYEKFGTDTVDGVSLVYGTHLPGVQWTHTQTTEDDPLVAIRFKTNVLPNRATVEEVKWITDVPLINPQIISKEEAVGLLQNTPEDIDEMANVIYMPYSKFNKLHKIYSGGDGAEEAGSLIQRWSDRQNEFTEAKKTNWVHHVTYLKNVEDIAEQGLQIGGAARQSNFPGYEGWTQGKNFVTTTADGVEYWITRLYDQVLSRYESGAWEENNWVEEKMIPVVMRFPFNMKGTQDRQHDPELGEVPEEERPKGRWGADHQGISWRDFYIKRSIPAQAKFQLWNGNHWQEPDEDIDVREFVDQDWDEYIQEDHPEVPQEMAFYWVLKDPYPLPFWD